MLSMTASNVWQGLKIGGCWTPHYSTVSGQCFLGDSLEFMKGLPANSINLIVTSPPYALHFKKEYGNVPQHEYVSWFKPFGEEFRRILKEDGSVVLDVGGS